MPTLRRVRPSSTSTVDPLTRISEHFILADFLGNQSVYAKGYANPMAADKSLLVKMDNLKALANHALEPIMAEYGPFTISYGYISPSLSEKIVKYQDPTKPSHHRFDLGAAVDICVHDWVRGDHSHIEDLFLPPTVIGSPIGLAHAIDQMNIPYSRLITYSESPYVCIAVAAREVERSSIREHSDPRRAFYENRYQGRKGAKPEYIQLSTQTARNRHFAQLQDQGLEHDWVGHGYPTYHGGGYCQYQHRRVSRYTMVSDWLLDLQSIANGAKNIPALTDERVLDSFAACGMVYDWIVQNGLYKRMSIIGGYVCPMNPSFTDTNDWRTGKVSFDVVLPASGDHRVFEAGCVEFPDGAYAENLGTHARVFVDVDCVLSNPAWDLVSL